MADNNVHVNGNGWISAIMTIVLGIVSKILGLMSNVTISEFAGLLSIVVGFYHLFINWPNFKRRFNETFKTKKNIP
jgi:hypothetical protein